MNITLTRDEVKLILYLLGCESRCLDEMWTNEELPEFIVDYYNSIIQDCLNKLLQ